MGIPDRSTRRAAVFIDLENIGTVGRSYHFHKLTTWLLSGLRDSLPRHRLEMDRVWAAAQIRHDSNAALSVHKRALHELFREHNGVLTWSTLDADSQIIRRIDRLLDANRLPPVMILVSSDNDFAPVVARVRAKGIHTIVARPHPGGSPELEQSADRSFTLIDLIGRQPPINPRGY